MTFVLPSAVAAMLGTVAVGALEGVVETYTALQAATAAGFFATVAGPFVFVAALIIRALWRSWRPAEIAERLREEDGGAPRLLAWFLTAHLCTWLLTAFTFNVVRVLMAKSKTSNVVGLATALLVTAAAGLLVLLVPLLVRAATPVVRRVDRIARERLGRTIVGPRTCLGIGIAGFAALAWGAWTFSIKPRIGHLDIGWTYYLMALGTIVVAVHLVWPIVRRRAPAAILLGAASLSAYAGVVGLAFWVRYQRPYTMLEVWGNARLAGDAIDVLYDVHGMRRELRIEGFEPAPRPGARPRNVVLITIDTLRADRTPVYDGEATMPELASLAERGIVFEWAFSPGNVTRRSLPAIALGQTPFRTRGRPAGWALRLDPRHVPIGERFRAAGYETAGYFCCAAQFHPRHRLGLIRGIDELRIVYDGDPLSEDAAAYLRERLSDGGPERPLFFWVHFIEPHQWESDYPPGKYQLPMRRRYDLALEETDRYLGRILDVLEEPAYKGDTVIILTADHSEGLGDHGHRNHSTTLYNAQIRVPLIIVDPELPPRRVERPVDLTTLAATMLDLAGFVPPGMPQMDGASLGPVLRGEAADDIDSGEAYSVMVEDRSVPHSARALVHGRHKIIKRDDRDKPEVYDIEADPDERRDLVHKRRELKRELVERLDAYRRLEATPPF